MARQKVTQKQQVQQIVKVVVGELPKKKRKKKRKTGKKKSAFKLKSQPEPYQIPLHYPPFPATIPRHKEDNSIRVADMLRNYIGVQKKELNRLRGDLTAYRQEAQTAFRQNVAYPRDSVDLGQVSDPSEDFTEEVRSDITDASVYNPPSPPDAPSVVLSLEAQPILTTPQPVNADIELLSVQGLAAEQPPAPIPLLPEPMRATPLPAPPAIPVTLKQMEMVQSGVPAMPLMREPSFTQEFERPRPPVAVERRGGRRAGAGRPSLNYKSNTELRQILKDEYGIVGLSRLSTNELRQEIISASGNPRIIYKD